MVFDTMVLVYALLGVEPFRDDAIGALQKPADIVVPDSFFAEFANVLWQWVKNRDVAVDHATALLHDGEALVTEIVSAPQLTAQALQLAMEWNVAVYDTLFVSLAIQRNSKLISFDGELLQKFPDLVISPSAYVGRTR